MSVFADRGEEGVMKPIDIDEAIESVVEVSRNVWKNAARCELELDPALLKMVENSLVSVQAISDVLDRLRNVNAYRTEPYLTPSGGDPDRSDERILAI